MKNIVNREENDLWSKVAQDLGAEYTDLHVVRWRREHDEVMGDQRYPEVLEAAIVRRTDEWTIKLEFVETWAGGTTTSIAVTPKTNYSVSPDNIDPRLLPAAGIDRLKSEAIVYSLRTGSPIKYEEVSSNLSGMFDQFSKPIMDAGRLKTLFRFFEFLVEATDRHTGSELADFLLAQLLAELRANQVETSLDGSQITLGSGGVQKIDLLYLFEGMNGRARYVFWTPISRIISIEGRWRKRGILRRRSVFQWMETKSGNRSQSESGITESLGGDGLLQKALDDAMRPRVWISIADNEVTIEFDQMEHPGIWEIATFLPIANSIAKHIPTASVLTGAR